VGTRAERTGRKGVTPMVDATETFRKLSEKASKLNKSSDEINRIISSFEKKLGEMNLGVEVWYGDPDRSWFLNPEADSHGFTLERSDMHVEKGRQSSFIIVLGYAKLGNSWRLAVREGTIRGGFSGGEYVETFAEDKRFPLSEATRAVRMSALGAMEGLFGAIEKKADELLAQLEKGRKFVKSIE
jgi:hypothetical protein